MAAAARGLARAAACRSASMRARSDLLHPPRARPLRAPPLGRPGSWGQQEQCGGVHTSAARRSGSGSSSGSSMNRNGKSGAARPPAAPAALPPTGAPAEVEAAAPPGERGAALCQLEAIEAALHAHVRLPHTPLKLGLDTALGKVPFAGVFAYTAVGAYTLVTAVRYEAPPLLISRMTLNIILENSLRAIPFVGSWVAPAVTGGNRRNLQLLRAHVMREATPVPGAAGAALRAASGARRAFLIITWPLRRLSLAGLLAAAVALPLAVGAGALAFAAWTALRWLHLV